MNPRITIGDWAMQCPEAQAIRIEVFVQEQGVPLDMEWDEMDERSLHAIAYDSSGKPVGTGRLLPDGHIGRMAVRIALRGHGVGSAILQELIRQAERRGDQAVMLNAQTQAEAFYARHGFVREGEEFMEAGLPHIAMRRELG